MSDNRTTPPVSSPPQWTAEQVKVVQAKAEETGEKLQVLVKKLMKAVGP